MLLVLAAKSVTSSKEVTQIPLRTNHLTLQIIVIITAACFLTREAPLTTNLPRYSTGGRLLTVRVRDACPTRFSVCLVSINQARSTTKVHLGGMHGESPKLYGKNKVAKDLLPLVRRHQVRGWRVCQRSVKLAAVLTTGQDCHALLAHITQLLLDLVFVLSVSNRRAEVVMVLI